MTTVSDRCGGGDTATLVAGTLRGYRTWRPVYYESLPVGAVPLRSVQIPQVIWTPTLDARCLAADFAGGADSKLPHQAPAPECRCGIYGWYRPREYRMVPAPVVGVIAASGRIVMGTHGFRAQHATIVAVVTRDRRIVDACEDTGIAVYRWRHHLVGDYPPEDLGALLDEHVNQ